MMNRFQVQATAAYADGAYAPLANSETWRKDVDELGDGLFRYLVLELSTKEDCESWTEAIIRTETCHPRIGAGFSSPTCRLPEREARGPQGHVLLPSLNH